MRASSLFIVSLATASALVLAGCSSPGDTEEEKDRVSINSLMGAPDYEGVDWQDQERQVQEAIAECMREEGWEYIPAEYPDFGTEYTPEDQREQLAEQGFGIVYWTLNQGNEDIDDPYQDWVDPNQEYVEGLGEDEMTAYYESLYGTEEEQQEGMTTEIDPETGEEMTIQYGNGAGCQGEAYDKVNGDDPTQTPGYWEAVQVFYDELQERVMADPRMVELNKTWSACMKDAGYEYESQNEIWETVYPEFQERHDAIVPDLYKDPFEGWTEDEINDFFENTPQDEIDAMFNTSTNLTDDQRSQLEALLEEEIALALAEFECSQPFNEKSQDIYEEIEEKYALEHEDELRELAASLAADA
jgi:hypothetical protein